MFIKSTRLTNASQFIDRLKTLFLQCSFNFLDILLALILLSVVILSGCSAVPVVYGISPMGTPETVIDASDLVSSTIEPRIDLPQIVSPEIDKLTFVDDSYSLVLEYPADWEMVVNSAGDGGIDDAKALSLNKNGWVLVVYYKSAWDDTILGGDLPLGEVVERGSLNLLGRTIPQNFVVYEGKDKVMFAGERFDDLEFYIHFEADVSNDIDYYSVALPESLITEVDQIVAGIIRTEGTRLDPVSTKTPSVQNSVPYCDWAAFVKDVTIPDGTQVKTGETFVKTWRLQNSGECTWTPDYALVFSRGTKMGSTIEVAMPETVLPGETVDLSVALTAPEKPGSHRGYWMLRNATGVLFGLGPEANKPFFVDIRSHGSSMGTISGRICFPSEHIPAMNLYLANMEMNKLTKISTEEGQLTYQVQVEPGSYLAYAWTLNFELGGGYTQEDHRLVAFEVNAGEVVSGIDICDWYGPPGSIPKPTANLFGTITGNLSFPSEHIPPLRVVAVDIYTEAAYWVDTGENQSTYQIKDLMPGYYVIMAYERNSGLAGGYSEAVKCDYSPSCSDDHSLVVIYITPGETIMNINPADWYAPPGTFPSDPTYYDMDT